LNPAEFKVWRALSWPNRISLLRLLLVAPFVVLLMNQQQYDAARYAAAGIFVFMALSDALDGMLARRLNAKTRLGAILDPLADKTLVICATILLSLPDSSVRGARLPSWVVVCVVGKDLWVTIGFVVIYLVTDRLRTQPTVEGKAATFGQLIMVGFVLIAPELNRLGGDAGTWAANIMSWCVAALCVLAVMSYTRRGLGFITAEQKPLDDNGVGNGNGNASD